MRLADSLPAQNTLPRPEFPHRAGRSPRHQVRVNVAPMRLRLLRRSETAPAVRARDPAIFINSKPRR